ncbi:hypothetical protein HY933_02935 [Candidatus Falkowbacteria bacterium]|nr:hypothetical protein [Candidatus Falkowbacteria bacterium]
MNNSASSAQPMDSQDINDNKLIAALSYVWVLFLIPLLAKRDSKFCQFHAKQGLLLFLVEVVGWLVFWIPIIGWLLFLAVVVVAIIGILKALSGQYWELPVLGEYAKKINL